MEIKTTEKKNFRNRLRKDWDQRTYQFWARPIGDQAIEDIYIFARKQHQIWNRLVELWRSAMEAATSAGDAPSRKKIWEEFWTSAYAEIKEAPIGRSGRAEMTDRLKTGVRKVFQDRKLFFARLKRGDMEPGKQAPQLRFKSERFIEDFHMVHYDGGGGIPVEEAFTFHNTRRWRWGAPAGIPGNEAYDGQEREQRRQRLAPFFFGLEDGIKVPLEVLFHRPLPPDGLVKQVVLSGHYARHRPPIRDTHGNILEDRRWRWSLGIVVEMPPAPWVRRDRNIASLDLGWRVLDDWMRIGMILDSAGNCFEIGLPLRGIELWSQRERGITRMLRYVSAKNSQDEDQYSGFDGLREVDRLIGENINWIKSMVQETIKPLPVGFAAMRQRGLAKLLRQLENNGAGNDQLIADLHKWQADDHRLQGVAVTLEGYVIRKRRKAFELIAQWLAENYRAVIWEKDLSVKQLGEEPGRKKVRRKLARTEGLLPPLSERATVIETEDRVAMEAGKYRRFAAIGELRQIVKDQLHKRNCALLPGEMPGTTRICWYCGGMVSGDQIPVDLTCENGHIWDQDLNACRNLLDQFAVLKANIEGISKLEPDTKRRPEISDDLRIYIRERSHGR